LKTKKEGRGGIKRISLIGSIVADTAVRPLDQLPAWGAALNVGSVSSHLGGNGAGAALAAARLGAPVRLAGAVGDDSAGAAALALLAATGVDVSGVRTLRGSPSAQTVALISSSGDRLFLQQPGASAQLGLDDIDFSGPIDLFHYASPFNLTALRPSAAQVIERARDCGAAVSLDVDWDPQGEWLDLLAPLCPALDYLFLNRQEAKQLSGLDDPDAVCAFFRRLGTAVVIL
jgi:sugar/nucleoside kinase (ribokinase family)